MKTFTLSLKNVRNLLKIVKGEVTSLRAIQPQDNCIMEMIDESQFQRGAANREENQTLVDELKDVCSEAMTEIEICISDRERLLPSIKNLHKYLLEYAQLYKEKDFVSNYYLYYTKHYPIIEVKEFLEDIIKQTGLDTENTQDLRIPTNQSKEEVEAYFMRLTQVEGITEKDVTNILGTYFRGFEKRTLHRKLTPICKQNDLCCFMQKFYKQETYTNSQDKYAEILKKSFNLFQKTQLKTIKEIMSHTNNSKPKNYPF